MGEPVKRLKLLVITRDFSNYVDRNTYYLINELSSITDLLVSHSFGDIHRILEDIPEVPHFILMNEDAYPHMTGLANLDIPFGIVMYDIHHGIEERTHFILENNVPYIFSHYRDKFHEWYPQLSDRMHWLPLFVNTEIFKDYQQVKDIDWLMMGKTGWGFYPLRNKMLDMMKNQEGFVHHPHPGYRNISDDEEESYVGERYAREINRAKMFLTCGLIYEYPILKYYEVLACNTLLLAPESRELLDLGFVPGRHFVSVDESDFIAKAEYYRDHEEEREVIAATGCEMVHTRHSVAKRARELVQIIGEILNQRVDAG